jgi:hypothetical protein
MTDIDSDRRPGLGETIFAVYGITRGMHETGLPRISHRFLQRAVKALRRRFWQRAK